jgi:hypothetical protein
MAKRLQSQQDNKKQVAGSAAAVSIRVKPDQPGKPRGSWEHLRKYQYQKGTTGNPGGRPGGTGKKISESYNVLLGEPLPADLCEVLGLNHEDNPTWADAIALQVARKAIDSNSANPSFQAITELRETTEGKTPEKSEFSGAGGAPLDSPVIHVNFVKPEGEE